MVVPFNPEGFAVIVDIIKEEKMKKPQMMWILSIKVVEPFKTQEEGSPPSCKLSANLHP
jgi:hypothetical protein